MSSKVSGPKQSRMLSKNQMVKWFLFIKQMEAGKRSDQIKVDVRVSVVKPLHAKWIVKYYDKARTKPQLIISGWKESGITDHLAKKIDLDPFSSLCQSDHQTHLLEILLPCIHILVPHNHRASVRLHHCRC